MPRRLLDSVVRRLELPDAPEARAAKLVESEWLVTNGLGGYASGTVSGSNTRRYHGVLVAALANPFGRMVMLNQLDETVSTPTGATVDFGHHEANARHIAAFRLEAGVPVWELDCDGVRIEKRVLMPHGQNTVHVIYRLLAGNTAQLELRPSIHFRGYEQAVTTPTNAATDDGYTAVESDGFLRVSVQGDLPPLQLRVTGGSGGFRRDAKTRTELEFPMEKARGYDVQGRLWSPGSFVVDLRANETVSLVASTERVEVISALPTADALSCEMERRRRLARSAGDTLNDTVGVELVVAADQFIITPVGRVRDATRAKAQGAEIRTIIAGYHWFTDWGRDTMISLEGLTLTTGRHDEAAYILRTFAHYVRDGLIPNLFPDGSNEGALSHRRRDALVLPRPRAVSPHHERRRADSRAAAGDALDYRQACTGYAFRHRRRPG